MVSYAGARWPNGPLLAPVPFISGLDQWIATSLRRFHEHLAFGLANLDQSAVAGSSPAIFEVLQGSYDPEASRIALNRCEECLPYKVVQHHGVTFYSWGADHRVDLRSRHLPPAFDDLGRGGRIAIQQSHVFRTLTTEAMHSMIDSALGGPSLADLKPYKLMAESLEGVGVYSGYLTNGVQIREEAQAAVPDDTPADVLALIDEQLNVVPLLIPYQAFASGAGKDHRGHFMVLAIAHANEADARRNEDRLRHRVREGISLRTGEFWSDIVEELEIQIEGPVLVAKLRGEKAAASWLEFIIAGDPLLLAIKAAELPSPDLIESPESATPTPKPPVVVPTGTPITEPSPTPTVAPTATPKPAVNRTMFGTVESDETWTGEILITGDIWIPEGVTLTVAAGTIVRFTAQSDVLMQGGFDDRAIPERIYFPNDPPAIPANMIVIGVAGTLRAEGTEESPILFTSDSPKPSVIDWQNIAVQDGTVILDHVVIEHNYWGVGLQGDWPTVSIRNTTFRHIATCGICTGDHPIWPEVIISGNEFIDTDHEGIDINAMQNITVLDNVFRDNVVGIVAGGDDTLIEGNMFIGNERGILAADGSSPTIVGNLFAESSNMAIHVHDESSPTITRNNFIGNKMNIGLGAGQRTQSTNVSAEENWWGTVDLLTIERKIHHRADDATVGFVDFKPFAKAPFDLKGNP